MSERRGKCPECGEIIPHLIRRTELMDFDEWWIDNLGYEQVTNDWRRENQEFITYECPQCGSEIENPHEVFEQDVSENEPGEALPE